MKRFVSMSACVCIAAVALAANPAPLEKYEVLSGEDLQGSGFVIKHSDAYWGVCSLHQFEGKSPAQFERLEGQPIKLDRSKVVKQMDVQVLPVQAPAADLQYLSYLPEFELAANDELVVLGPAGDVFAARLTPKGLNGKPYRSSAGPVALEARTEVPFIAAGGSGAPIILKKTGAVIGVLLTADDGKQARAVGFETLCYINKKP